MKWSWLVFVPVLRSQAVVPLTDWCLNKNDFMYRMAMSKQRTVKEGRKKIAPIETIHKRAILPLASIHKHSTCHFNNFIMSLRLLIVLLRLRLPSSVMLALYQAINCFRFQASFKLLLSFFQLLSSVCPKRSSVKVFRDPEIQLQTFGILINSI